MARGKRFSVLQTEVTSKFELLLVSLFWWLLLPA